MIMLFYDSLYHLRQFDSAKDPYSNYRQFISVAGQQRDARSFIGLVKRIEVFSTTECACERHLCQLRNLIGDFRREM
jgi:hypothetical protein